VDEDFGFEKLMYPDFEIIIALLTWGKADLSHKKKAC